MDEARDYLAALQSYLSPDIRQLPEERQLEYLSELLSHHHRHHRYRSAIVARMLVAMRAPGLRDKFTYVYKS